MAGSARADPATVAAVSDFGRSTRSGQCRTEPPPPTKHAHLFQRRECGMKKGALLLVATGLTAAAAINGCARGLRPVERHRVEPPGGAADRGRSGGRQHGRLRVRQPRQGVDGDARRELHPVRGSGGRAELLQVRSDGRLRAARRQRRRREGGRELRVPVQDHGHEPEHVPLQHRPDRLGRERRRPEREADLQRHACHRAGALATARSSGATSSSRRRTSGRARTRPTTRTRASRASAPTARSSPGRATTRSSSTSGRSSTSVVCGRSTRST